jgi:hypothetical protein
MEIGKGSESRITLPVSVSKTEKGVSTARDATNSRPSAEKPKIFPELAVKARNRARNFQVAVSNTFITDVAATSLLPSGLQAIESTKRS